MMFDSHWVSTPRTITTVVWTRLKTHILLPNKKIRFQLLLYYKISYTCNCSQLTQLYFSLPAELFFGQIIESLPRYGASDPFAPVAWQLHIHDASRDFGLEIVCPMLGKALGESRFGEITQTATRKIEEKTSNCLRTCVLNKRFPTNLYNS